MTEHDNEDAEVVDVPDDGLTDDDLEPDEAQVRAVDVDHGKETEGSAHANMKD